jgi:hypothetical protein
MNSTIKIKKKICKTCKTEQYIFSKGNCKRCAARSYAPIRRTPIASKKTISPSDDNMQKWFDDTRKKLTGICQCGCGNKSQKNDDTFFRGSCCHIFPKRKFKSIRCHPLNYVERAMFGGCHSIMDDTSIDRWVNFADWDDIKARFYVLSPLLTDEEKTTKFYSHLENLVLNN